MKFPVLPLLALLAALLVSRSAKAATVIDDGAAGCPSRWAFEYGVAFITSNTIDDLALGQINISDGDAGGQIHHFTASYLLAEPEWRLLGGVFRPQIEAPLTVAVVDENGRSPFLDYSASFQVRWRDFPWNHVVRTSVAMGLGISYSEKVYLMDIQRHPDRDRSHLKFNWPIQATLAHPAHPRHQLMLFVAHQSGGRIFDRGGVNSLGLGYRLDY